MELATYFILPLTKLNFRVFGKFGENWNLKSTKIDLEEKKIYCEVYDIKLIYHEVLSNQNFNRIIKPNKIVLDIPETINETLTYFKQGKYSEFHPNIKKWIKSYAGLPQSHKYLRALDKDKKLREEMEFELGVKLDPRAELLEAPMENWFIVKEKEGAI